MAIRPAKISDYDDLRPLFDEILSLSPFPHLELQEDHMRRMWVMSCAMPVFFNMVSVDDHDKARGVLAGIIEKNVWGANVATDILSYSKWDTHKLILKFKRWAAENKADAVMITELTGNPRYQSLISSCGFDQIGTVYRGQ